MRESSKSALSPSPRRDAGAITASRPSALASLAASSKAAASGGSASTSRGRSAPTR